MGDVGWQWQSAAAHKFWHSVSNKLMGLKLTVRVQICKRVKKWW